MTNYGHKYNGVPQKVFLNVDALYIDHPKSHILILL